MGDTPRDSFELYVDPTTHRLHACRYVMTYASLMPPGTNHAPEHVVVFEDLRTVDGLVVPFKYTNYAADHTPFMTCEVTDWSFTTPFDATTVVRPEGAVVDTTRP